MYPKITLAKVVATADDSLYTTEKNHKYWHIDCNKVTFMYKKHIFVQFRLFVICKIIVYYYSAEKSARMLSVRIITKGNIAKYLSGSISLRGLPIGACYLTIYESHYMARYIRAVQFNFSPDFGFL